MIVFMTAVEEELKPILSRLPKSCNRFMGKYRIYQGSFQGEEFILFSAGIGKKKAEKAVDFVFKNFKVSCLYFLGFAGALTIGLNVGDIVVCSEIYCSGGKGLNDKDGISEPLRFRVPEILLTMNSEKNGMKVLRGKGVTVPEFISEPSRKKRLNAVYGAEIVDMESYWVGAAVKAKGVPFLAVRSISDSSQERIPPLDKMLSITSKGRRLTAFLFFLYHPVMLRRLLVFYGNLRKAGRRLGKWAEHLMLCRSRERIS